MAVGPASPLVSCSLSNLQSCQIHTATCCFVRRTRDCPTPKLAQFKILYANYHLLLQPQDSVIL